MRSFVVDMGTATSRSVSFSWGALRPSIDVSCVIRVNPKQNDGSFAILLTATEQRHHAANFCHLPSKRTFDNAIKQPTKDFGVDKRW